MAAHEVEKEYWTFELAPYLTGKAQPAYASLEEDEAKDYDKLKDKILKRYDINEETYQRRFGLPQGDHRSRTGYEQMTW